MTFEYPSNYYGLRRVLTQQIRDKLISLKGQVGEGKYTDREEVELDIKIFARDLSTMSGMPLKGIVKLLADQGVIIEIKNIPKVEL